MTEAATGPGSRRYKRYEDAGEDVTTKPEADAKPEPRDKTEAEERRAREAQAGLNQGIPLHRGADQATHDAVVAGLHGRNRSEAEIEAEKKRRHYEGTNSGTPIEHVGVSKKDRDARRKAAADELEVE